MFQTMLRAVSSLPSMTIMADRINFQHLLRVGKAPDPKLLGTQLSDRIARNKLKKSDSLHVTVPIVLPKRGSTSMPKQAGSLHTPTKTRALIKKYHVLNSLEEMRTLDVGENIVRLRTISW